MASKAPREFLHSETRRIEQTFVLSPPSVVHGTLRNGSGQECVEAIDFRRVAGDPDGHICAKCAESSRKYEG